jgi:nucleoid-associated protein YgaU
MHANAADVSGNNVPVTGGTYNADGVTVADVLSTAVAPAANVAANTQPAPAPSAPAAPVVAAAPQAPAAPDPQKAAPADHSGPDLQHTALNDMAHHFHHVWG